MVNSAADHGPRISGEEYDRRIVALQEGLPPVPSREQAQRVRRAALDLAIDHRLGQEFPADRREALWAIQQRVDGRQWRLIFKYLLRRFFAKSLVRGAQGLAASVVSEYAKVLSKPELESFFGKEEAANPALPVDIEQLRS